MVLSIIVGGGLLALAVYLAANERRAARQGTRPVRRGFLIVCGVVALGGLLSAVLSVLAARSG